MRLASGSEDPPRVDTFDSSADNPYVSGRSGSVTSSREWRGRGSGWGRGSASSGCFSDRAAAQAAYAAGFGICEHQLRNSICFDLVTCTNSRASCLTCDFPFSLLSVVSGLLPSSRGLFADLFQRRTRRGRVTRAHQRTLFDMSFELRVPLPFPPSAGDPDRRFPYPIHFRISAHAAARPRPTAAPGASIDSCGCSPIAPVWNRSRRRPDCQRPSRTVLGIP